MNIILYSTLDNENVINKVLDEKYTISIKLKESIDLSNPKIILNDKGLMDFTNCNYAYLDNFNRYYFIRSIQNISNNVWSLDLDCDVLETFKTDILNATVELFRKVKEGDYFLNNPKTQTIKEIDIFKNDFLLDKKQEIVLSTIGKK